jgi:2-polyprenyl-3-methyl-5-hydroxy-6-metoxy-1,4-benzoquinol methylase
MCGSHDSSTRVERNGFSYVNCARCSFVFINPQLTPQAIQEVYNDRDVRKHYFEELLLPHVERDQKPEFEERAYRLHSLLGKSDARLLDIGCAIGNFLLVAQEHGFHGEGLELNELYIDYVRRNRPLRIHQKTLEEMRYPDGSFDVVTLWDVLEHLPKPLETMKEVARIVAPGGLVGLSTINHECINEKILKHRWRYYQPPDHLCSFTPSLLRSLLKTSGFTIVHLQHHYMFEVLADHLIPFPRLEKGNSLLSGAANKAKKLVYYVLAVSAQTLFNALHSGDLVTVYARKN